MRICIVGGGTAGWLAALMIHKIQGNSHDITLIESSRIGIVGAGEGSTGYLTDIIQGHSWNYGCNEIDFLRETGATVKLGIRHKDWKHVGHSYIGPIDGSNSVGADCDYMLLKAITDGRPFHESSANGYIIEKSLSSFILQDDGKLTNSSSHAYHFDAHKVGKYFKKVCGENVTSIDADVVDINLDENGFVTSIVLADGRIIEADFFIDCSGFKRIFASKLGVPWISYSKHLPVNRAMPFLMKYDEDEKIDPVTTAWAQKAGWMWQIPVQERKGCGYVYCDSFTSDEQAQNEIEQLLGKKIEPIRFFSFETGRLDQLWAKNCLFVGLSAAFAEPLEATSIHSTIVQLTWFAFNYLRDTKNETCNIASTNFYNRRVAKMYDDFRDFLVLHYMTERNDSEFWKWMNTKETATEKVRLFLELIKTRTLQPCDFDAYFGSAGASLHNWVMAGLGMLDVNLAQRDLDFYGREKLAVDCWTMHDHTMSETTKHMIDNTDFIRNSHKYIHGNSIS